MSTGVGISGPEIGDAIIDVLKQQVEGLTDLAGQYLATSRKLSTELQETQGKLGGSDERLTMQAERGDSLAGMLEERNEQLREANTKLAEQQLELAAQAEAIVDLQRIRDQGYERINELEMALERGPQLSRVNVGQPAGTQKLIGG